MTVFKYLKNECEIVLGIVFKRGYHSITEVRWSSR